MTKIALIDADSIVYRVCCAVEDKTIWNELEVLTGAEEELDIEYTIDLDVMYTTIDGLIENILFATECKKAMICIGDGTKNFRFDNPLGYKENRKELRKPKGFKEAVDYLVKEHKARLVGNNLIEVDDEVVYLKTKYPDKYMLCAIDKDVLYQTEGEHYNYVKDEFITVTKEDTIKYLFYQALVGDASDGYKGCKGVGDKGAKKLLDELTLGKKIPVDKLEGYLYKMLLPTFISKGHSEDYFLQTLRLASMHQYNGYTVELFSVK